MAIKGFSCATLLALSFFILRTLYSYAETDTLRQGQKLKDGGHLVSAFGTFRLGFFSSDGTSARYLGIWYTYSTQDEQHVQDEYRNRVWVANWKSPLSDKYGLLSIASDGNLKIFQGAGDPIAVSSVQVSGNNTSATLLENGNLVLNELNQDGSVKRLIWQSFDYPTDTLVPGMKIGVNLQTGHTWSLNTLDGNFSFGLDLNGTNQLLIWSKKEILWASGTWVEGRFNKSVELSNLYFQYFSNSNERYFNYSVDQDGGIMPYPAIRISDSDNFIRLGGSEETVVNCFFFSYEYSSPGCVYEKYPNCRKSAPIEYSSYYPRPSQASVKIHEHLSYYECGEMCLWNCSCVGFANDNDGCKFWSNEGLGEKRSVWRLWLILVVGLGGALLISSSCIVLWRLKYVALTTTQRISKQLEVVRSTLEVLLRKYKEKGRRMLQSLTKTNNEQEILLNELGIDTMRSHWKGGKHNQELQFFNFESVVAATNNFSSENKLGEGGFGPVYKGKLLDGQEVAIKRLSMSSRQGLVEFKNEVKVIAKLQHNNLVRLVGCCIEREEKILIYEYMPNKSLDFFLFDQSNRHKLDWKRRFNIVEGIAQGLLYLHKYSRLKIIHRDLKAGNILLDRDMNPKISDFGMAKIFGSEESKANTNRVVGTYGYMPPEYAIDGIFSTKSDVFSFGVLMLEIVSGKRCNSFHPLNIIVYAWELWRTGRWVELIDPTIEEMHHKEVMRCIHVGLLCVQENPNERPNMLEVVSILYNEASELPSPSQPAFYNRRNLQENDIAKYMQEGGSQNEVTITELEGR